MAKYTICIRFGSQRDEAGNKGRKSERPRCQAGCIYLRQPRYTFIPAMKITLEISSGSFNDVMIRMRLLLGEHRSSQLLQRRPPPVQTTPTQILTIRFNGDLEKERLRFYMGSIRVQMLLQIPNVKSLASFIYEGSTLVVIVRLKFVPVKAVFGAV